MERDIFENMAEDYERWFHDNDAIFASELAAISKLLPTDGDRVEIGCGTGIFAEKLGITHGVEPSDSMAELARNKGIYVLSGVVEAIPLQDKTMDVALMVTVDCFLDNLHNAFTEIRRILRKNGTLVIGFLDRETPLGQVYEENKHQNPYYAHANFHSAKEMVMALQSAGFSVTDRCQTVFSFENMPQPVKTATGEGVFAVLKAVKL